MAVNGIPDGLEFCGKDIRVDAPWVVTHADPPIGSSNKLTTPRARGGRSEVLKNFLDVLMI